MIEIEIKSPCDDLTRMERLIVGRGGKRKRRVEQLDQYYAHPCRDFAATDEALRIRREGKRCTLFYKGPKLDPMSKSREEIASPLRSPESFIQILERLGFRLVSSVEKSRTVYLLDEVEVSLDRVKGLGDFVELEVRGDDLEEGRSRLIALMNELGLEKSERRSYLELLLEREK
jgi:adenylate cyclase class 2